MQFVQFSEEPRPVPPRVLVAEDDDGIRRVVGRFLQAQGCEVVAVPTGEEALALLRHGTFDAVVSDIALPGPDGVEVWRLATEWFPGLRPRFVFISTTAPPRAVLEQGARYLAKPFEVSALWRELQAVLGTRGEPGL